MKRLSKPSAAITSLLTEPTSVTAQSWPAASRASAPSPGSAVTGAAQKMSSASSTASATVSWAESTASSSAARRSRSRSGSKPLTSAPSLARAASPIDPPIRPTPRTAIRISSGGFAPLPNSRGEPVQGEDGALPVHACVGDRLAVDQRGVGFEVLPARHQERLHHHSDDRSVPSRDLIGDLGCDLRLALVVLPAVVV